MWDVQISLTTLWIVVVIVVAVLVAKYRKGSHSSPADHSNLPASPAHIPQKSNEFRLNRAYRCFAFLGLITLPVGLAALLDALGLMKFDMGTIGVDSSGVGQMLTRWAFAVAMLLGVPILAGMLYATIYGIWQAVRLRHQPLVVLSAVSIICWLGTLIYIPHSDLPGHPYVEYAWEIGGEIYVAANLLIPAWWFTNGRRRYGSNSVGHE
jgi:hypothetical protein